MQKNLVYVLSELKEKEVLEIVKSRLEAGEDPLRILDDAKQAMKIVGKRFEEGTYFIPDLIYSGEILRAVSGMVKPKMTKQAASKRLGEVIIGTVKGDIHDIGKNIVTFMLDLNGFEVYDLGIDVPAERFIEKIRETKSSCCWLKWFPNHCFRFNEGNN